VDHRPDDRGRRRAHAELMSSFAVSRVGAILAVADVARSVQFYTEMFGFAIDATYVDPPYATLSLAGARLSLAEQGHPAEDRPGVGMVAPDNRAQANVVVVLEVGDCLRVYEQLQGRGASFLAEPYSPPWGGHRFFCIDPDGYLVEIEEPA
jgi:catechol 2,3-dioxygenase-like lactoylglutathione lyase family enzyme